MNKDYNYPSFFELEEVLSEMTKKKFVVDFAQKRGIFMTRAKQFEIAKELANLFFEDSDIEEIRNEAYQKNSNHTMAGFLLKSTERDFSLPSLYEKIRREGFSKEGQILNQLIEKKDENNNAVFEGRMEYEKNKIGRMEFLQKEKSSFDFYFKQNDANTWQVEVDCIKSTDSKELKKLLQNNTNRGTDFESIDQDQLTTEQAIEFFDELASKGLNNDWEFKDVKQLTFKKGNDTPDEEEEEEKEVGENHLSGIRQAILQGIHLRENPFVVQSVESGYKFTSMTYEFGNKNEPLVIQIKAEFKGRPKIFETSVVFFSKTIGAYAIEEEKTLSSHEDKTFRSLFWNNAKKIYDQLTKENN